MRPRPLARDAALRREPVEVKIDPSLARLRGALEEVAAQLARARARGDRAKIGELVERMTGLNRRIRLIEKGQP